MVILIFGVSNVGKSVTGEKLAKRLGYSFFDLDYEIKKRLNTTIEQFMKDNPYLYERCKVKGKILKDVIDENNDDMVIAVCPIYYARNFNYLLDLENVIGIELQDAKENIFDRLIFSDENDQIYEDEDYKYEQIDHYLKEIQEEITDNKRVLKRVKNKYFMDNRSTEEVVDDLMIMIQNITAKPL